VERGEGLARVSELGREEDGDSNGVQKMESVNGLDQGVERTGTGGAGSSM
jgi:hypothetical protein